MRTFQQKVEYKFSLFMIKSNEINLETINDVLLENGQQILGPKKKNIKKGFQTTHGRKQNSEKKRKKILPTKSMRQRDQLQAECRATDKEERADRKAYTKKPPQNF